MLMPLGVDVAEDGVEGGGLAAAGGAGDEDQALGAGDHELEEIELRGR